MVDLKVDVDGVPVGTLQDVSVHLGNAEQGIQMRSPWPFVHLRLTKEQAKELLQDIAAGQEAAR